MAQDIGLIVVGCLVYRLRAVRPEYLILRRHAKAKVYPNLWGVPSGKLSLEDFRPDSKRDKKYPQEGPLERAVRREIFEEAGIEVGPLEMIGYFDFPHPSGVVVGGFRYAAPYMSGEVRLDPSDATQSAWITAPAAQKYSLLGELGEEIAKFDSSRNWYPAR